MHPLLLWHNYIRGTRSLYVESSHVILHWTTRMMPVLTLKLWLNRIDMSQWTELETSVTRFLYKQCWGEEQELHCTGVWMSNKVVFFWLVFYVCVPPFLFSYHPILIFVFPYIELSLSVLISRPPTLPVSSLPHSSLSPSSLVPTALGLVGLSGLV